MPRSSVYQSIACLAIVVSVVTTSSVSADDSHFMELTPISDTIEIVDEPAEPMAALEPVAAPVPATIPVLVAEPVKVKPVPAPTPKPAPKPIVAAPKKKVRLGQETYAKGWVGRRLPKRKKAQPITQYEKPVAFAVAPMALTEPDFAPLRSTSPLAESKDVPVTIPAPKKIKAAAAPLKIQALLKSTPAAQAQIKNVSLTHDVDESDPSKKK